MLILQQWALIVFEAFQAFVGRAGTPLGPLLYIVDLSKPSEIAHMSFYLVELTISDFILVCATRIPTTPPSPILKSADIPPVGRLAPQVAGRHYSDLYILGKHW